MTLNKVLLIGLAVLVGLIALAMSGLFSITPNTHSKKTAQTTLFDGAVTYCYTASLYDFVQPKQTGLIEVDTINAPNLHEMNAVLKPYGYILKKTGKADPDWVPSGIKKWERLCKKVTLPKDAIQYHRVRIGWSEANYDSSQDIKYPEAEYSNSFYTFNRYWFVGDNLIHLETLARPANDG